MKIDDGKPGCIEILKPKILVIIMGRAIGTKIPALLVTVRTESGQIKRIEL